ncbi:hypothetical protein Q4511_11160 [Paracoccus sp. 1_MG-2023]|uniref:hypothetical protein n=1 Tax=unclassified Paracoccus (in: a-proteobacteria) TaxID=2688777 RepID=UPI001C08DC7B|nr:MULTISPECIES: hypothetical protein [unclassified Paracoccus (in: a-proteobacteria)]MDO6669482.1 hypothetical protein [Paracoccus sp. 1_MG-2023]
MSMYQTAVPASSFTLPRRLWDRFSTWRRQTASYRTTMAELNSICDRELLDLNLSRADFHRIAREAALKA